MAVMDAKPKARSIEEIKKETTPNDAQTVYVPKDEVELLKDVSVCLSRIAWSQTVNLLFYVSSSLTRAVNRIGN